MRRYDIRVTIPSLGRYEVIKENPGHQGSQEEDYWEECFTWQDLKVLVPTMRKMGWRIRIMEVEQDRLSGRIHLFPFTYGVNHDVRMFTMAHVRIILTKSVDTAWMERSTCEPFRY